MKLFFSAVFFIMSSLVVLPTVHPTYAESFEWVTENQNPALFAKLKHAFAPELQPDDPEKIGRSTPYYYKYIAQVGVLASTCLILIGNREKKEDLPYEWFRGFTYDLETGIKTEIGSENAFWKWTFLGFASFENSTIPDIVFAYFECLDCCGAELLASFQYDMKVRKWGLRIWPDNDPHINITSWFMDDEYEYDVLYRITDVTGDGLEDIVVRSRQSRNEWQPVRDEIVLYSVTKGSPKRTFIRKGRRFNQLSKILCKDNESSPLCK